MEKYGLRGLFWRLSAHPLEFVCKGANVNSFSRAWIVWGNVHKSWRRGENGRLGEADKDSPDWQSWNLTKEGQALLCILISMGACAVTALHLDTSKAVRMFSYFFTFLPPMNSQVLVSFCHFDSDDSIGKLFLHRVSLLFCPWQIFRFCAWWNSPTGLATPLLTHNGKMKVIYSQMSTPSIHSFIHSAIEQVPSFVSRKKKSPFYLNLGRIFMDFR